MEIQLNQQLKIMNTSEQMVKSKSTLYPELYIFTAETDVVRHFAAVNSGVIALQRANESKGVVRDLNTLGHQSIQPVQKRYITV